MKKKLLMAMSVVTMLMAACSDEAETPEEFNSVSSITIADNASDGSLTVGFQVNSIIGANEFWVVLAKESSQSTFTATAAAALSDTQIKKVVPAGTSYSVNILASQLDTDGDAITGGTNYVVFVFEKGSSFLSSGSSAHTYPEEQVEQFSGVSGFVVTEVATANEISKIKVEFTVNTIEGVDEFWVLVAKNSPTRELTNNTILTLSEDQYTLVTPSAQDYEVEIEAGQIDTDGDLLQNQGGYRIYVFGKGVDVLSDKSSAIILQEIEVYAIEGIWAHDVANNQNSSDLRVVFDVNSTTGIQEFRVFVSTQNPTTAINSAHLETLGADAYTAVPATSEVSYNIKIDQDQLDTDGNALVQDQNYLIHVYTSDLGVVNSSESILLSDNILSNGKYVGQWNDNLFQNIPFSAILDNTGTTIFEGPAYVSLNFTAAWGGVDDGKFTLDITGNTITSFTFDQDLPNYMNGCPGTYTGSGTIAEDLSMTINFTGDDCDGHHEDGVITLERYWKD